MNTVLTELQQKTLSEISTRRKTSPITGTNLAFAIGLQPRSSGREGADLHSIIHALRVKGYPICANGKGYFWPETKQELHDFIQSLQARTDELQGQIDGLGAGYYLIGGPEAVQAVQDTTKKFFQDPDAGKVYEVSGAQEERFLKDHPNAYPL